MIKDAYGSDIEGLGSRQLAFFKDRQFCTSSANIDVEIIFLGIELINDMAGIDNFCLSVAIDNLQVNPNVFDRFHQVRSVAGIAHGRSRASHIVLYLVSVHQIPECTHGLF